ncbi:MAG: alpha/beta hydrolase-fold protein [Acidobacteriota bacterium]
MKNSVFNRISGIVLLIVSAGILQGTVTAQEESPDSPRIAALAKEIKSGNAAALPSFWEEVKGKAPLVEPIAGDDKNLWVTFVWRGDSETKSMGVFGGAPFGGEQIKPLSRLGESDIWYRTERLPKDSRFTYTLMLNPVKLVMGDKDLQAKAVKMSRRDPLNPRSFPTPPNAGYVELPDAPPQTWIKPQPDVPKGEIKSERFKSDILAEDRSIKIYTPPGYDPNGKPCALLIYFDGEIVPFIIPLGVILDNLIAKEKIPPTIAVMISSGATRMRDLACSPKFADFLAKDLVPNLRSRFRISADPKHVAVSGVSLGGLMAAYSAMRHPEVIGNVLSQSGSYWYYEGLKENSPQSAFVESGWLAQQYSTLPKLPLKFYLEVGKLEQGFPINMVLENRRMRDTLVARGYPVTYSEYSGGHDMICWRGSLADGLIALLGKQEGK